MPRILLIDDDERLAEPLQEYLARFELELVNDTQPQDGLARLAREPVDLLILDVMLPGMDGFEVCRVIRKFSEIPILMLTARGEVTDRVVGLELGADDYLPKPFEPRELVARIQNILKRVRSARPTPARLAFGPLVIDLTLHQVALDDVPLKLTTMEYRLLEMLANAPGRSFSRDEILNHLKGVDGDLYTRSVDILVSRLRHKLKPLEMIQTVWGSGYRLVAADAS